MSFLLTLALTLIVVVIVLFVFVRVGVLTYRIDKQNVITLLEMVLACRATTSDWDVFIGVPIQHDPKLEEVRQQCQELAEREGIEGEMCQFTIEGRHQLSVILANLKVPEAE